MALAIACCVQMFLVAQNGEVRFVEENSVLLYVEIGACVLILLFAITVFVLQLRRLGEKRRDDGRQTDSRG